MRTVLACPFNILEHGLMRRGMHLAIVPLDINYAYLNTDGRFLGEFNGKGNVPPPDHPSTVDRKPP